MMNKEDWEKFKTIAKITKETIEYNIYLRKDILFNDNL